MAKFTPDEMKDHFAGMRQIEEERIAKLEQELERAKQEIIEKERIISELKQQATFNGEEIGRLEQAKAVLDEQVAYIQEQLSILAERDEKIAEILDFMNSPDFPVASVNTVLQRFDSDKRWVLSDAKKNMEKAEAARASQKAHAEMGHRKRKAAKMRGTMSLDEDSRQ